MQPDLSSILPSLLPFLPPFTFIASWRPYLASLVAQWWRICLQCRRHSFAPGLGRSLGKGNGNPLQYSCLGYLVERRAPRTVGAHVHGVTKNGTWLRAFSCCWSLSPKSVSCWLEPHHVNLEEGNHSFHSDRQIECLVKFKPKLLLNIFKDPLSIL